MGQFAPMLANGTVPARNGSPVATTTKLIALLRITASSAANLKTLIRSGKRTRLPRVSSIRQAHQLLPHRKGGSVTAGGRRSCYFFHNRSIWPTITFVEMPEHTKQKPRHLSAAELLPEAGTQTIPPAPDEGALCSK